MYASNPDYYSEWKQHCKKYFGDVTNLYDVTIRRFMFSYTFFGRHDFLVRESLTRFYEKCFKGLLSLVVYLVHLRHSWQNGENDKGPSMGSRLQKVSSERKMKLNTILQNHHGS